MAVAADTDGDAFVYHLDDEELLALSKARADTAGQTWSVAHLRVHADLLVLTPVAGTSRRRGAGSRRTARSGEVHDG